MATQRYIALDNLNNGRYQAGDPLDLTDAEADPLLAARVIRPATEEEQPEAPPVGDAPVIVAGTAAIVPEPVAVIGESKPSANTADAAKADAPAPEPVQAAAAKKSK